MARGIFIFITMISVIATVANAATPRGTATASRTGVATAQNQTVNPASSYTYNYMYPYLNNQMRTTLKPYDATSPSTSPINAVVRTEQLSEPRRVVSRPAPKNNAARVATNSGSGTVTTQRRVVPRATTARVSTNQRRVVSRPTQTVNTARDASRAQNEVYYPTEPTAKTVSSKRCLADYTECMNRYCERADTAYNRCYCSAKLSQIDAEYQPQIESLVQQIIALQNGNSSFDAAEFNEYWESAIGQYTSDNSWTNIDDALNIDWSTMESRVRGQNAFITGHEYCVQHLAGCFYMASNMRDVYRSTIARDCATYEAGLERLKTVAESVVATYSE